GSSPEEAERNGCKFDIMMSAWLPSQCSNRTLSEEYLNQYNWQWYADPQLVEVFSLEQMRKGQHRFAWTTPDFHVTHCAYMLERMVRSMKMDGEKWADSDSVDIKHVHHCADSLL
ncbi:hypothetical protein NA57DRAFT_21537, partial [Rhizodiscina lignyota]